MGSKWFLFLIKKCQLKEKKLKIEKQNARRTTGDEIVRNRHTTDGRNEREEKWRRNVTPCMTPKKCTTETH